MVLIVGSNYRAKPERRRSCHLLSSSVVFWQPRILTVRSTETTSTFTSNYHQMRGRKRSVIRTSMLQTPCQTEFYGTRAYDEYHNRFFVMSALRGASLGGDYDGTARRYFAICCFAHWRSTLRVSSTSPQRVTIQIGRVLQSATVCL
jgi:hypothetical protein